MAAKQIYSAMPTSNQPPMREWATPYWYVLRTGALQAKATLTETEVADLITWFKAFAVVTPCPDCRTHFASDWERHPFTADQARDPFRAMSWVEDLRARIEGRKKVAAANTAAAAPAPETARPTTTTRVRNSTASAPSRVAAVQQQQRRPGGLAQRATGGSGRGGGGSGSGSGRGASVMHQRLALRSAMQQTAANLRAPSGCTKCGKARKEKPVV